MYTDGTGELATVHGLLKERVDAVQTHGVEAVDQIGRRGGQQGHQRHECNQGAGETQGQVHGRNPKPPCRAGHAGNAIARNADLSVGCSAPTFVG
jgi:hypothetical protein